MTTVLKVQLAPNGTNYEVIEHPTLVLMGIYRTKQRAEDAMAVLNDIRAASKRRENSIAFNYRDCEMPVTDGDVILWYVVGLPNVFYPTKIVAEQAARLNFPDDANPYGRVFWHNYLLEVP